MKIAIIGTGNVGGALARSFTQAGEDVVVTSRNADEAAALAAETHATVAASAVDAATGADVIILAVPFAAAEAVSAELAGHVAGGIVVDATNPLNATYDGLVTEGGPSGAERIQALLPEARVAKAFNTAFASIQADPDAHGTPADAFVAADDEDARSTVLELSEAIGFNPVDAGPLANAGALERLAFAHIALQGALGQTWRTAIKVLGVPEAA